MQHKHTHAHTRPHDETRPLLALSPTLYLPAAWPAAAAGRQGGGRTWHSLKATRRGAAVGADARLVDVLAAIKKKSRRLG